MCKGKGYISNVAEKVFTGFVSFGMIPFMESLLMSDMPKKNRLGYSCCSDCGGTGKKIK